MNSYNHYAYGAVADWIYRYAGPESIRCQLTPDSTPFFFIRISTGRIGSLDFSYDSSYGTISLGVVDHREQGDLEADDSGKCKKGGCHYRKKKQSLTT